MYTNWRLGLDISFIFVTVCAVLFIVTNPPELIAETSYCRIDSDYSLLYGILTLLYSFYFVTSGRLISALHCVQRNIFRGRHFQSFRWIRIIRILLMPYWMTIRLSGRVLAIITCCLIFLTYICCSISNESLTCNLLFCEMTVIFFTTVTGGHVTEEFPNLWLRLIAHALLWLFAFLLVCTIFVAYTIDYLIHLMRDPCLVGTFSQSAGLSHDNATMSVFKEDGENSEIERERLVQERQELEREYDINAIADLPEEGKEFIQDSGVIIKQKLQHDNVEVEFRAVANELVAEEIKEKHLSECIDSDRIEDGINDGHFQSHEHLEYENVKQNYEFNEVDSPAENLTDDAVKNDIVETLPVTDACGQKDLINIDKDDETGKNIDKDNFKAELAESNDVAEEESERTLRTESTEDENNGPTSDTESRPMLDITVSQMDLEFIFTVPARFH